MLYVKVNLETNEVIEFPIYENDLREKHLSGTTLPNVITDFSLVGTPYRCVLPLPIDDVALVPTYTHSIEAISAVYNEDTGAFDRVYGLVEVIPEKREVRKNFRLNELRKKRNAAFVKLDAKFARHASQVRLGVTPTDNIADLDAKAESFRNVTELENIWGIRDSVFFEV